MTINVPINLSTILIAGSAALLAGAQCHAAEPQNNFGGLKLGANVSWDRLSINRDVAGVSPRLDANKGGIGVRGFLGYDVALGPIVLGAEAGIGLGGRTVSQAVNNGNYGIDPGVNWDLSSRAGVAITNNILLFGRVGYRWQRAATTLAQGATTTRRTTTEDGLTFGGGAELAVAEKFAVRTEYMRTSFGGGLKANQVRFGAIIRF